MKEWKKVDNFAGGVIYACGNERKIVIPGAPDIYFEVESQEVQWYRPTSEATPSKKGSRINE